MAPGSGEKFTAIQQGSERVGREIVSAWFVARGWKLAGDVAVVAILNRTWADIRD